jgi:16S rRNA (guanine(966)-N(2))-methyltransferase RsmD
MGPRKYVVRIVAGSARGRRLRAPRGRLVRPTTDRVKEAMFSMLTSRGACADLRVLDLFAGTGGLAIEALSRGAASAVLVDSSRAATQAINANLAAAEFTAEVLTMPVARALAQLAAAGRRFDGVLLDPPYEQGLVQPTLTLLDEGALVQDGGWVVVEHGRDEAPPARLGGLVQRVHRCYGDTWIALFVVERSAETVHDNG